MHGVPDPPAQNDPMCMSDSVAELARTASMNTDGHSKIVIGRNGVALTLAEEVWSTGHRVQLVQNGSEHHLSCD